MNDIHDNLAPIAPAFFSLFDWIVLTGLVLVLAGIIWWIWRKNGNKNMDNEIVVEKKFVPVEFLFDDAINNLETLKQNNNWKVFALEATAILKKTLEKKYCTPFEFATGNELQEIMSHKDIDDRKKMQLSEFFDAVDPIKFAHKQTRDEQAEQVISILKEFNKL